MKLSEVGNTLAYRVNHDLLPKITTLDLGEIKQYLVQTFYDPKISMAKETRTKYKKELDSINTLVKLQFWVYNLALKTSGDGVI